MTTTKNVQKARPGTKTSFTPQEVIELIQSRIIVTENGCHEWQGPRTKDGYGQFGEYWLVEQYGIKLVHRMMVHVSTGFVFTSRDQQVMHSCHNRPCCNPQHLSVGTSAENMRQVVERRLANGFVPKSALKRPGTGHTKGEAHVNAKLTEAQVIEIRARRAAGEKAKDLGREFGVSGTTISAIHRRRKWRHVA